MMNKKGFTLIEILVAMTIVAVLMSLSLVSLQGSRKAARDGKRKADLEQIRSALEIYRSDCKTYPAAILPGRPLQGTEALGCNNTYMDKIPNDPILSYTYTYDRLTENSYILCSYLENQTGSTLHTDCAGNCGGGCYYKVTNY